MGPSPTTNPTADNDSDGLTNGDELAIYYDGLPDIVGFSNTNVSAMLNQSKGASSGINGTISFASPAQWSKNFSTGSGWGDNRDGNFSIHSRSLVDVNNDGYKDFVSYAREGVRIGLNNKTRFPP